MPFAKVLQARFGDVTGDEQRRMMTAFLSLLDAGVEDFVMMDDRGGTGCWMISIEEETFNKLPPIVRRQLKRDLELKVEAACGSINV